MVHVTVHTGRKQPPGAREDRARSRRRRAARVRRARRRVGSARGDAPSSRGHGRAPGPASLDAHPWTRRRPGDVRTIGPSRRVHHRGVPGDPRATRSHGEASLGRRRRGAGDDPDPAARLPGGARAARHVAVPSQIGPVGDARGAGARHRRRARASAGSRQRLAPSRRRGFRLLGRGCRGGDAGAADDGRGGTPTHARRTRGGGCRRRGRRGCHARYASRADVRVCGGCQGEKLPVAAGVRTLGPRAARGGPRGRFPARGGRGFLRGVPVRRRFPPARAPRACRAVRRRARRSTAGLRPPVARFGVGRPVGV